MRRKMKRRLALQLAAIGFLQEQLNVTHTEIVKLQEEVENWKSHMKRQDYSLEVHNNRLTKLEQLQISENWVRNLEDRIYTLENPPKYQYDDEVIVYLGGNDAFAKLFGTAKADYRIGRVLKYNGCRNEAAYEFADKVTSIKSSGTFYMLEPGYKGLLEREHRYTVECGGEIFTAREEDIRPYTHKEWDKVKPKEEAAA